MIIEDQIRNEKLQYHIKRLLYHQAKSTNMNILLVKKYCYLLNSK